MCLLMCTNRQSMRWDVTSGLVGGMMYHYTIATEPRTMIGHDLEGSGGDAGCRRLPERKDAGLLRCGAVRLFLVVKSAWMGFGCRCRGKGPGLRGRLRLVVKEW
jgi:hypothetical protein